MSRKIPDTLSMIRALIEQPSISSTDLRFDQSNLKVIQLLAEWLEQLGFHVAIKPVSERKANLLAFLGEAREAHGLVLSGHTDTVPYDEDRWTFDPFRGTVKDGRLYGLGSADMKAFFALVLEAASHYSAKDLRQPLVVLATADEESNMSGARALAAEGILLGRYAVIGEPTDLRPIRMHKGVMMESIRIDGQAGHSSDPSLGASALEGMIAVLNELLAWRAELQKNYRNPLFKVAFPTLNVGSIHGGDNPNRICSQCVCQFDLRPLPGMDVEELRAMLEQRLSPVLAGQPRLKLAFEPLFEGLPPFETAADSEIVKACEDFTGHAAGAVAFGTEAPFLSRLGLETVIMGPGSIEQAHQLDEYVPLDQVDSGVALLRKLIDRFCLSSR